jgi:hypothetical protein
MAEKDVDEQFAAIMARWDDEALGHDPYGDPTRDPTRDPQEPDDAGAPAEDAPGPHLPVRPETVTPPLPMGPTVNPAPSMRRESEPHPAEDGHDDEVRLPSEILDAVEDDDVHYSPPPPAPLPPSEDKHFWTMMVALVGGPLMFLYLLVFNRDGNGWWMMFSLMVAIGGFVLLVLRQPLERDEGDDGIRL